jgi:hypothetical protein
MRISVVDIPVAGHTFAITLATKISSISICSVARQASPRQRCKQCLSDSQRCCAAQACARCGARIILMFVRLITQYKQVQIFGHRGKPDCGMGGRSAAMFCDAATTQQAAWAKPHVRKVSSTLPNNGYRRQPL